MSIRSVGAGKWTPILALLLGLGCGGHDSGSVHPDAMVLIVIDTLRGDHLGCAGYPADISPNLDLLANRGARFTRAYTAAPITLPSIATLMTGLRPYHHGVRDNRFFTLSPAHVTLAEKFKAKGWHTAAVVGSAVLSRDRGLDQGFETYDDAFQEQYVIYDSRETPDSSETARTSRRAETVTEKAIHLVRSFGEEPFFLFVHYWDVHFPYDPPPQYVQARAGGRYAGEVRYVDSEIGKLLEALSRRPGSLVLVVGDHGEGLMQHGEPQHGFLLYDATLHVPLIVAGPGVTPNTVRHDPVSLVDVAPSLAKSFDLPDMRSRRDGRVLLWDREEKDPPPLYAETFRTLITYGWSELRSLRYREWKLIEGRGRQEWFNLARDPDELQEVTDGTGDLQLARALAEINSEDPAETVCTTLHSDPDPERAELLQSLGYVSGDDEPLADVQERPHPRDALPKWLRREWARAYLRRAEELMQAGALELAASQVDSVLTLDSSFVDAWFIRGVIQERLGNREQSPEDWARCLELDARHAQAHRALAHRAMDLGNEEEAQSHWTRLVEIDDKDEEALLQVAIWHLGHGETSKALPPLRRLVELRPESADIRYNLGLAAARSGLRSEAEEHWRRYLLLSPDGPRAGDIRAWLEDPGVP